MCSEIGLSPFHTLACTASLELQQQAARVSALREESENRKSAFFVLGGFGEGRTPLLLVHSPSQTSPDSALTASSLSILTYKHMYSQDQRLHFENLQRDRCLGEFELPSICRLGSAVQANNHPGGRPGESEEGETEQGRLRNERESTQRGLRIGL